MHKRVRVRVPATTSNLGPGFDVLGLALKLYNEIDLEALEASGPDIVEISGEGETTLPRDQSNMVLRAVRSQLPRKKFPETLHLRLTNRIPLARGLGSSAAARLGGILAANALIKRAEAILEAACGLEGHPDNVVAAFYGGLCIAVAREGKIQAAQVQISRGLGTVVCVPDFELSTEKARKVLPRRVSRQDAVATSCRTALLIRALEESDFGWLRFAMQDVLHQPYRSRLVPAMEDAIEAAVGAGACGAALSGAGPSIFAFAPRGARGAVIGRAMQRAFAKKWIHSRHFVLEIDRAGATVEILK